MALTRLLYQATPTDVEEPQTDYPSVEMDPGGYHDLKNITQNQYITLPQFYITTSIPSVHDLDPFFQICHTVAIESSVVPSEQVDEPDCSASTAQVQVLGSNIKPYLGDNDKEFGNIETVGEMCACAQLPSIIIDKTTQSHITAEQ